jgi:hypothetical protein
LALWGMNLVKVFFPYGRERESVSKGNGEAGSGKGDEGRGCRF